MPRTHRETNLAEDYDLIVIGAGSGGVAASRRAAAHGARVLIAEADRVGGTCVIRGCVPKKLMMYAAGFAQAFEEARGYGWTEVAGRFEMSRWADAKAQEIEPSRRHLPQDAGRFGRRTRRRPRPLAGPRCGGRGKPRTARPAHTLIATGGAPTHDAIPGLAQAMTSNEVLDLRELPATLLVVGGGYIAVEFASILAGLGVAGDAGLPRCAAPARLRHRPAHAPGHRAGRTRHHAGRRRGAAVAWNAAPTAMPCTAPTARCSPPRPRSTPPGARPNTAGLGLAEAGVRLDARGAIAVDADSRSSVPGIWAIGDVTNRVNLTPVAIAEGRAFADTEFGAAPGPRGPPHGRQRRLHRPADRHRRTDRGRRA